MHKSVKRLFYIVVILLLSVGVVCSCCSCAIQIKASTVADKVQEAKSKIIKDVSYGGVQDCEIVLETALRNEYYKTNLGCVLKCYSNYLDFAYSQDVITRCEWLEMLIDTMGIEVATNLSYKYTAFADRNYFEGSEYVITAIENGIIGSGGKAFDPYCAVTRQYVANSLINAVGYDLVYKLSCSDYTIIEDKKQVAAAIELGYLSLDDNNCFNPYSTVSDDDVSYILDELEMLKQLRGKTVMSFGDSIMHGDGNRYVGIADLLAERYLMNAVDYSKGGSTFSKVVDREQISDQIIRAYKHHENADIILINGGTNDMRKSLPGVISTDFAYEEYGRQDFCSGMEYALGLLGDYYPSTPVLYIRAHNMEYGIERNELHFGELALDICEKWEIEVADIFSDSGFDGHDELMKSTYTVHTKKCANGDSVHPNRLGYYKFYLPIVSSRVCGMLSW